MMTQYGGNIAMDNKVNNNSKGLNKWALFGLGGALGLACGTGVGIALGKREALRRAKETLKTVRREAHQEGWNEGFEQASAEAQAWIDENILVVDGETPEEIAQNTARMMAEKQEAEEQQRAEEAEKNKNNSGDKTIASDAREKETANTRAINTVRDTKEISPGNSAPESNLKETTPATYYDREYNQAKIEKLYMQDGLNVKDISRITGYPENVVRYFTKDLVRPGFAETDEDIDNYDLSIDEDEDGEEAREMTEARERYLDEVDRYLGDPTQGPCYISRQEFEDEAYLEKVYVDYFEKDNVFVSNDDAGQEMDDPVTDFGTADGKELFAGNPNREDPDIVMMKNFKQNAVYEITRYHEAYASLRDGSAFVNGSAANDG